MACKLCDERQREINRILRGYAKDKKLYRLAIVSLFATNLLVLAFGADGIKMLFDFVTGFIK